MMLSADSCFFEGDTERSVLETLKIIPRRQRAKDEGGKSQINERIKNTLGPKLGGESVRCLILRDLDSHVNETSAAIKQSVVDCFRNLFRERGFDEKTFTLTPHTNHQNVFVFAAAIPDIKVALHVAEYKYAAQFKNATIDDYIVNLALRTETVQQLIRSKREARRKEFLEAMSGDDEAAKISQIAEAVVKKVLEEIPHLLQANNFPALKEAKQYLQVFSAITQEPKSPAVITKDIIQSATDNDKEEVLASLLVAINFVSSSS
jgi:hypothetical protein